MRKAGFLLRCTAPPTSILVRGPPEKFFSSSSAARFVPPHDSGIASRLRSPATFASDVVNPYVNP